MGAHRPAEAVLVVVPAGESMLVSTAAVKEFWDQHIQHWHRSYLRVGQVVYDVGGAAVRQRQSLDNVPHLSHNDPIQAPSHRVDVPAHACESATSKWSRADAPICLEQPAPAAGKPHRPPLLLAHACVSQLQACTALQCTQQRPGSGCVLTGLLSGPARPFPCSQHERLQPEHQPQDRVLPGCTAGGSPEPADPPRHGRPPAGQDRHWEG